MFFTPSDSSLVRNWFVWWHFPSALSPEAHAEWGLYKILEYMELHEILPPRAGKNRAKLRKDIEEYHIDLTCKRGSVGQSEGLSIPRSSVRFRLKPDTSNSHEFEFYRPSNKGTKLLLKVIKAIIIIMLTPSTSTTQS